MTFIYIQNKIVIVYKQLYLKSTLFNYNYVLISLLNFGPCGMKQLSGTDAESSGLEFQLDSVSMRRVFRIGWFLLGNRICNTIRNVSFKFLTIYFVLRDNRSKFFSLVSMLLDIDFHRVEQYSQSAGMGRIETDRCALSQTACVTAI